MLTPGDVVELDLGTPIGSEAGLRRPAVVITAGRYDLFCEVVCEDNEHLLRVLTDRFAAIEGIRSTETLVELRFVKESYQWGAR